MEWMSSRETLAERRDEVLARGAERIGIGIDFPIAWEPWTGLPDCAARTLEIE
jgi:hypothetical protein